MNAVKISMGKISQIFHEKNEKKKIGKNCEQSNKIIIRNKIGRKNMKYILYFVFVNKLNILFSIPDFSCSIPDFS